MYNPNSFYEHVLLQESQENIHLNSIRLISAGTANQSVLLYTDKGPLFLKSNFQDSPEMFHQEIKGLNLLRKHCPLQIPKTVGTGRVDNQNYLLIEWIEGGYPAADYWKILGHGLAEMHMATSPYFGLEENNFISILPQRNTPQEKWVDFYVYERLEPMLGKALFEKTIPKSFYKKFQLIYQKLDGIIPNEKPALVHGDLWSGNVIINSQGKPCLIDPAVYYGHREMDLAFSKLFGGFESRFYDAYNNIFPLEPGFNNRADIYNLYPLLVHLNLFGKSYLPGLKKIINKYV